MTNKIIQQIEAEQMNKEIPAFAPGDTVIVQVKVKEGDRQRLQAFEGVVIAKRNRGLNSAFTVRKISNGVGVERTFQTYSPIVDSLSVKRRGDVRKAKLYYLRALSGKAARIKENWSNPVLLREKQPEGCFFMSGVRLSGGASYCPRQRITSTTSAAPRQPLHPVFVA